MLNIEYLMLYCFLGIVVFFTYKVSTFLKRSKLLRKKKIVKRPTMRQFLLNKSKNKNKGYHE